MQQNKNKPRQEQRRDTANDTVYNELILYDLRPYVFTIDCLKEMVNGEKRRDKMKWRANISKNNNKTASKSSFCGDAGIDTIYTETMVNNGYKYV